MRAARWAPSQEGDWGLALEWPPAHVAGLQLRAGAVPAVLPPRHALECREPCSGGLVRTWVTTSGCRGPLLWVVVHIPRPHSWPMGPHLA